MQVAVFAAVCTLLVILYGTVIFCIAPIVFGMADTVWNRAARSFIVK